MTVNPNIQAFINYQNGIYPAGSWPAAWDFTAVANGTPANPGTNEVTGFAPGSTALGSGGFNVVMLDGVHAGGAPQYKVSVDGTGLATITDTTSSQAMSVAGGTVLLFQGGIASAPGQYNDMMIVAANAGQATIASLYDTTFGRMPDLPGLEYWWHQFGQGQTVQQIAQQFITSNEGQAMYPASATDADFVNSVYTHMLGRSATSDPVGLSYWTGQITSLEQSGDTALQARANVLTQIAQSAEEASHTASWLVNTAQGGYADAGALLPSSTVMSQATASNYLNAALIDPATVAQKGNTIPTDPYAAVVTNGIVQLVQNANDGTVQLSASANVIYSYGVNETIDGASSGGSKIAIGGNSCVVALAGNGNEVQLGAYANLATGLGVSGFNATDKMVFVSADIDTTMLGNGGAVLHQGVTQIYTPTASAPISGSSLTFTGGVFSPPSSSVYHGVTQIINLGDVGGGSVAEVVAKANQLYKVADVAGESIIFIGQAGLNTVVDYWGGLNAAAGDTTHAGVVLASDITETVTLTGVQANTLTVANFH